MKNDSRIQRLANTIYNRAVKETIAELKKWDGIVTDENDMRVLCSGIEKKMLRKQK